MSKVISQLDELIDHHEIDHHGSAGSYATEPARAELAQLRADIVALQEANTTLEPYSKLAVVLNASSAADVIFEVDALYSELAALREENLRLGAGEYLLREIGAALNCSPDATILQRIAEQARRLEKLRVLSSELVNALGYWFNSDQEPQDVLSAELALGSWLAANAPAPQAEHGQPK